MSVQNPQFLTNPTQQERTLLAIDQNIISPAQQDHKPQKPTPQPNQSPAPEPNNRENNQPLQQQDLGIRTTDLIYASRAVVDFGECLPGSIHESEVTLFLAYPLEPIVVRVRALCIDSTLNDLSQYVFGIRRPSTNEFVDECRLKLSQGPGIKLIVGVKAPSLDSYANGSVVRGVIVVEIIGLKIQPLTLLLEQKIKIPNIECIKEIIQDPQDLADDSVSRIVKIAMKKRGKKQARIPLKNPQNYKLLVDCEMLGPAHQKQHCWVDCAAKNMILNPRSQAYCNFGIRMSQQMRKQIEGSQGVYKIRRVLVVRVKQSSVLLHFPIEIAFYEEETSHSITQ